MDLTAQSERLAVLFSKERLHPRAIDAAESSLVKEESWLIALSGGADSVALLWLLWTHFPQQRSRMTGVHFNHRLRAEESEGDESFCRQLCGRLGLSYHSEPWRDAPSAPSEDDARQARYSFFKRAAEELGAALLFTGHQKDDIVETQLMRLARGTSSAGLAAPRPIRRWGDQRIILRPLLTLTRGEIQEGLRIAEIGWREDSSNATNSYFRNRVRRDVVPKWLQAAGPQAVEGAALTREWLEDDDTALEQWLDRLGIAQKTEELNLRLLVGQPRALWRRALRRWKAGAGLSRQAFDDLLTLCQKGEGRRSVGHGFAVLKDNILRWSSIENETSPSSWQPGNWSSETYLFLPNGGILGRKSVEVNQDLRERFRSRAVDISVEAFVLLPTIDLVVRSWMPGDRYLPMGAPGKTKLQDLFVNRKVPPACRHQLPIICAADGAILWVPGFPPAEHSKVVDDSVTAVQLTYTAGTITIHDYSHF